MNMPLVLLNRRRRGGATAFSPSTLFALAEPGVWFDPSDLTTLFQDPAGTTPVTTPGNTVGLMLDKSKGLALGADTGTDFSSATGWSLASGISISGGALVFSSVAAGGSAQRTGGTLYTAGVTRVITVVVTSLSGGTLNINTANAGFTVSAAGTYTARITGVANNYLAIVAGTGTVTASLDNISVRELAGNHATQAITAARPTYSIEPVGGRRNLVIVSEPTKAQLTVSTAGVTDAAAFGTFARSLQFPSGASAEYTYLAGEAGWVSGVTATVSVYVRMDDGLAPVFGSAVTSNVANDFAIVTRGALTPPDTFTVTDVGGGIYRVSTTGTTGTNASNSGVTRFATNSGRGFRVTGYTLELGSTATPYQRVTTTYDVTEAGVASLGYLFFDGSGDFMSTGTITPGTDKAQVFTGVRKNSDAAVGIVAELSSDANSNNGSFFVAAPGSAASNYGIRARGAAGTGGYSPTTYAAPITNVVAALLDLSGANVAAAVIPRIDGAVNQTNISAVLPGGGNFLAYPLYIGYRNATTNLYFNGQLFPLIVRFGPNLTTARISATESWVASKTPGVTL